MSVKEVEQELRRLIDEQGPITFAQFQKACLYSPNGGFYSSRAMRINDHFSTSATSHPAFGALIARQLEQMWRLMGEPERFDVVEVGSGDGSLARAIIGACEQRHEGLTRALRYVAADYEPWWPQSGAHPLEAAGVVQVAKAAPVQRVKAEGLRGFRGIQGCILTNELHDNFPVHRFAIQGGQVHELYVTWGGDAFVEQAGEPSSAALAQRLSDLGVELQEGMRGEIALALDDWAAQVNEALERGFVLNIDYGEVAEELYSPEHAEGTLVCFSNHVVGNDPYANAGEQDITSLVDFTSLRRLGEKQGLTTLGYSLQSEFLMNLGFEELLNEVASQDQDEAMRQLGLMVLMSLVDPEEYGIFKVLAQSKGMPAGTRLQGFASQG